MKKIVILLFVLFMSGCAIKEHQIDSYDLYSKINLHYNKKYNKVLMVDYPNSLGPFGGSRIYYKRDGITSYYLYSKWSESLNKIVYKQLLSSLEEANLFKSVVGFNSSAKADITLETQIESFYHIVEQNGSYADIQIEVKLIDNNSGKVIASKKYVYNLIMQEANAKAFREKAKEALSKFTKELISDLANKTLLK